jgi:hypothetical protein
MNLVVVAFKIGAPGEERILWLAIPWPETHILATGALDGFDVPPTRPCAVNNQVVKKDLLAICEARIALF